MVLFRGKQIYKFIHYTCIQEKNNTFKLPLWILLEIMLMFSTLNNFLDTFLLNIFILFFYTIQTSKHETFWSTINQTRIEFQIYCRKRRLKSFFRPKMCFRIKIYTRSLYTKPNIHDGVDKILCKSVSVQTFSIDLFTIKKK